MAASSVTIRVDSDIKEGASRIAEHFGFDLSSVTRAFYKQMIRENRIPLNLSDPEPNAESLEAIRFRRHNTANLAPCETPEERHQLRRQWQERIER